MCKDATLSDTVETGIASSAPDTFNVLARGLEEAGDILGSMAGLQDSDTWRRSPAHKALKIAASNATCLDKS